MKKSTNLLSFYLLNLKKQKDFFILSIGEQTDKI